MTRILTNRAILVLPVIITSIGAMGIYWSLTGGAILPRHLRPPAHTNVSEVNADPSGVPVPIGNQPGWRQVFYDNFSGESVPLGGFSGCTTTNLVCTGLPSQLQSKWWDYPDGWPDTEQDCQYWPSQTLSIAGGIMNMYIHTANGTCMTAVPEAKLPDPTGNEGGQLYGMYSVRMRADALPDYITAFLLWPDDETWPQDGEIDFPNSSLTSNSIDAYMHHEGATSGSQQDYFSTPGSQSDWHTYTIQWAPTYVNFLVDGKSIGESTRDIPDTPMHWVLQTESDTVPTVPDPSTAGNLQVDWAAIWAYDPSITSGSSSGSSSGSTSGSSSSSSDSSSGSGSSSAASTSSPSTTAPKVNGSAADSTTAPIPTSGAAINYPKTQPAAQKGTTTAASTASLVIKVVDSQGRPVKGATVALDTTRIVTTPANGTVVFADTPLGTHSVTVRLGNGKPVTKSYSLTASKSEQSLIIPLKKTALTESTRVAYTVLIGALAIVVIGLPILAYHRRHVRNSLHSPRVDPDLFTVITPAPFHMASGRNMPQVTPTVITPTNPLKEK